MSDPQRRGIEIETLDLLHACPIWRAECLRPRAPFFNPVHAMRERWSHKRLFVAAPQGKGDIPVIDVQTSFQLMSYWMCRTTALWEVVGPTELLAEWRNDELPYIHSIYLCQHEIIGD